MRKQFLRTLALTTLLLFITTSTASAYSVGEDATFEAESIKGSQGGESNTTERTEQERFWDNANYINNKNVSEKVTELKEIIQQKTIYEYVKTSNSIIYHEEVEYPIEILVELLSKISIYYPGGYYYTTSDRSTDDNDITLTDEQNDVLEGILEDQGFDVSDSAIGTDSNYVKYPGHLTEEEIRDLLIKYGLIDGYVIREKIIDNVDIIEFETYEKRYEALEMYLDLCSTEETVKTQYIIEIKAEQIENTILWSSIPQTWGVSGKTHFWQFECMESQDGEYHEPMLKFDGATVSQAFYYPGKYHVSATQILQQEYYDTMSYSVNQYWIVEETGQVIWKSETRVKDIPTSNEIPLEELNLSNVINYNLVNSGTYYVSVFDQEINVTSNKQDEYLPASGVWGYKFSTQRIG